MEPGGDATVLYEHHLVGPSFMNEALSAVWTDRSATENRTSSCVQDGMSNVSLELGWTSFVQHFFAGDCHPQYT